MKNKRALRFDPVFVVWGVLCIVLVFFAYTAVMKLVSVLPKETTEQKFTASVKRQGAWFVRNQKPEGNFVYEQISATGQETDTNNIVRQAGALYGLGHVYRLSGDPSVLETFEQGLEYFKSLTSTPSAETAAITHEGATFTNTVALVVLGLSEYMDADEHFRTTDNLEYLVRLSNYLVSTQTSEGAYINSYDPEPSESDYNNGETMYALMRSYNLTQKEAYLSSAKRMGDYAIEHYGKNKELNKQFFSWSMAGFAYLYKVVPDERYWDYMKLTTDKYYQSLGNMYEGYFHDSKHYAPIQPGSSVFLEGIGHIGWIAKEKDPALYKKLRQHAKRVLENLLAYEINSPYGKYKSDDSRVSGGICSKDTCETTRIDFLQHNLSAMYFYLRFFK